MATVNKAFKVKNYLNIPHGSTPANPVNGDIWTTTAGLYARIDGITVGPFGTGGSGSSVTVSDTPPSSPTTGNLWYESDTGKTFIYYDSFWVEIGSQQTAPTVQLTGDVTGTGSGNISTTLASSGVTSGTYGSSSLIPIITVDSKGRITNASTASITGGISAVNGTSNQITATTNSGVVTLTLPNSVTTPGDLIVTGSLTVNGTTTTVNSTTLSVDDPIITLGGDTAPVADDNKDRGIEFRYYDTQARLGFMGYDDSAGTFVFLTAATNTSEVFSGTKGTIDANISGSNINSGTVSATYIDSAIARLSSPTFTGTPAAPTAAVDTNTTQIATTAFVVGQAGSANPLVNGTVAVGTSLRYSRQDHVHPTDTSRAPTASPTFTGTITTPLTTAGYVTTTSGGVLGSVATIPNAGLTNSSITIGSTSVSLGGTATTVAGLTLTSPVIDTIAASAAAATPVLWSTVTTGSIGIGQGLTTGALNIATVGTGVTPITIGHTNATLAITTSGTTLTTAGALTLSSTISASGLAGSLLTSTVGTALGAAAAGTSTVPARSDHVHPTTGLGLTSGTLAQFAATTSAQLAGVISDETGFSTGAVLVFSISPALTGTPTAPTATAGTNTTQIATTEFVQTAVNNVTINTQTASYQLALTDAGKVVEMNVGSANNLTVPPSGTVNFPIGTTIDIVQYGAGQTTIVAGSGVTLRASGGKLKLTSQYSAATLYKRGTDEWVVMGDLTA